MRYCNFQIELVEVARLFSYGQGTRLPLVLLADNAPAFLNEVVVCEHKEVSEGSSACSCSCGSGDEVLQGSVKSEGGKQVLLIHSEASCIVCMYEQGRGEG